MGPGNILEAKSESVFKQSRLCIMTNVRNVMYGTVKELEDKTRSQQSNSPSDVDDQPNDEVTASR